MHRPTSSAAVFPLRLVWLALCGLATTGCATPTRQDAAAASTPSKDPMMTATAAPSLSLDDLNQRVLRLIDGIRTREDLAPAQLQRLTGVDVEVNAEDPTIYGIAGPVEGQGRYSLVSSHKNAAGQVDSLLLSFEPGDAAAPCASVEGYRNALAAAGFSGQHLPAGHRGNESWYFTRQGVSVNLHVRPGRGASPAPDCVASMVIGIYQ
ncbi:hypothetical protein EA660_09355 [Pseudoxanthomonas winnipegensis]|jgi:hypothetical protein|uniref:Secreted protein n=2 Tax=Pseudoxanthomonas winnipegensis TaxID=2480810 RepID=A0A4Q8LB95_9GAMM|nr:hypothetical protein EA660_09355 [Pseudoxanthomonas winnipegensis]